MQPLLLRPLPKFCMRDDCSFEVENYIITFDSLFQCLDSCRAETPKVLLGRTRN